MAILITLGLAIIGALCTLAFTDMVAFKRLARAARPLLRYINYVAFGALVATLAMRAGTTTLDQITNAAIIAILGAIGLTFTIAFLVWLREGMDGFRGL